MPTPVSGIVAIPFAQDLTAALVKDAETTLKLATLDANAKLRAFQEGAIRGIDLEMETAAAAGVTVKVKKGTTILKSKAMGTGKLWQEAFEKEDTPFDSGDELTVTLTDTSTTPTALNNVSAILYVQLGRSNI